MCTQRPLAEASPNAMWKILQIFRMQTDTITGDLIYIFFQKVHNNYSNVCKRDIHCAHLHTNVCNCSFISDGSRVCVRHSRRFAVAALIVHHFCLPSHCTRRHLWHRFTRAKSRQVIESIHTMITHASAGSTTAFCLRDQQAVKLVHVLCTCCSRAPRNWWVRSC